MIEQSKGFERRWYTKLMDKYRWSNTYIPGFNQAARAGLRWRFVIDRARVNRICQGREDEINEWFKKIDLFFGFTSIRGGTVFLANMLKLEVPGSHIEHEANVIDYWNLPKARLNENDSLAYVKDYRRNEIFSRSPKSIKLYGEVNPFIRCHCKAFQYTFPTARFFHLVRDPRDVVRSVMAREIFSRKDPMLALTRPKIEDPYYERWDRMSRFEKVCWEWQSDNRQIRKHVSRTLKFEDMMNNFSRFKSDLLDYLGIEMSEDTWASYVNRPRNASRVYRFDHWKTWDAKTMETFLEICGDEMAVYGYGA